MVWIRKFLSKYYGRFVNSYIDQGSANRYQAGGVVCLALGLMLMWNRHQDLRAPSPPMEEQVFKIYTERQKEERKLP